MFHSNQAIIPILLSLSLLIYALKKGSQKNIEAYSVANRNVGIFALTATLVMTEFNTATLISFSSLGYLSGIKALALPTIFLIGLLFYAITVSKKWKEFNGLSVVGFFIHRYDKNIGALAGISLLLAMSGFSAIYLKSLSLLFENLFPHTSYWTTSAYIVLLTLFMVIRKGLVSIIKVDAIAFLIILIALPFILFKTYSLPPLLELHSNHNIFNTEALSTDFISSLLPLTLFSYILAPWYGQRLFAAKNTKTAYTSVILSAIFVFLFYSIAVLISYLLALKGITLNNPEQSFPYALNLSLEPYLYPTGYILLLLISLTTLTGLWHAMANIFLEFTQSPNTPNFLKSNIPLTLLSALITYLLSNTLIDNILNKMILANIPVIALSFALFAGFYWPKVSLPAIYTSILVGILSGITSYLYFGEDRCYTYYWAFIGIPAIFISGFLVSWLYPLKSIPSPNTTLKAQS